MDKIPKCFGGFSFELTEEEQKEYEKNKQIMNKAEAEYIKATIYGHGGSVEDRKKEFWDVLNILFDGSNEVPLKIISAIDTEGLVRIIKNAATEMSRIRMEGRDNANRAFQRGKRWSIENTQGR